MDADSITEDAIGNSKASNPIFSLAKKELRLYFQTPVAYLFIATFLLVSLFVFFWLEKFFARNIVDVRPLFSWMPILLIFLVSALSMRMWSEEAKVGTVQFLRTMPVKTIDLVLGKFLACLTLCVITILLTLSIPASVAYIGDLDFGPVIGGYVAAFLLAAAYCAIGLFASSLSKSQIVALILSILFCSIFYLIGSPVILGLLGQELREVLSVFSTSSHFTSIERGILDFRDIFFYLSLTFSFLALNVYNLERERWSKKSKTRSKYYSNCKLAAILLVLNLLLTNLWLNKVRVFRLDLTQGNQYTISDATKNIISNLKEPMLVRGYFSDKTHPLLAPLVVQIKDLLKEYQVFGGRKLRVEFINPKNKPEIEKEANEKYGIKPVPFQISGKYEASLVNSYFNILIQYGAEHKVLNFQDLIEIKQMGESELDVKLRNLEYDITSNMKKVMYGFQSTESIFASLNSPLKLKAYVSSDSKLPKELMALKTELKKVGTEYKNVAKDNFELELIDPKGSDSKVAKEINEKYGFRPMALNIFDKNTFYFYLLLTDGTKVETVSIPKDLSPDKLEAGISEGVKRFAPGFVKNIGLYTPAAPPQNPMLARMGMGQNSKTFNLLRETLGQNYNVEKLDLSSGVIPSSIDIAVVASPKDLSKREVFAIDQFLMKGGTIVLSTGAFEVEATRGSVSAKEVTSGLEDWLITKGIEIKKGMVYDLQNEPYPVPVTQNRGGFTFQEIKLISYPLFPDVRSEQFNQENGITAHLNQVTFNWPSAIEFNANNELGIKQTKLISSSPNSWFIENPQIKPDYKTYPDLGFNEPSEKRPSVLGAMYSGNFVSYFKGKNSPLKEDKPADKSKEDDKKDEKVVATILNVIEKSQSSAKLIVYSSSEFLSDSTLKISAAGGSDRFRNSLELISNTIDWSLEDRDLLSIRNRAKFSRTIAPLKDFQKQIFEYSNYLAVLIFLLFIYFIAKFRNATYNQSLKTCLS